MTDPRVTKLAENLINNAIALKAGENILIETTDTPDEVSTELVKAVAKVGGNAFVHNYRGRVRREMIKSATIEQMQLQADLLKVAVNRPLNIETTAQGVAFMAGLGAGIFSSKEEIKNLRKTGRLFKPEISTEAREKLITDWHNGIGRTVTK